MTRRIRRLIGGIFIITAIIFTQIPPRLAEAASVAKEYFLLDEDTLTEYTGTATTVSVSDDIKVIGEEAFANNPYLGVINIGKNVKEIRHGAFANCTYLNRVIIPDNVTSIGSAAFSGCTGLINVSLGAGVEEIGDGVFAGCKNLAGISVSRKNDDFKYEAGVLYDDTQQKIYTYLSGNQYPAYQMPNSVEHISPYSFWGNENLKEVYLSSRLCEVPAYSFSNCKNLKSIQIPYSVNYIDAKAFENCVNLSDVEIPGSVTFISPTAFDGCPKLNIIADEGTYAYDYFKNYEKSDINASEDQDAYGIYNNVGDEIYYRNGDSNKDDNTYSSPENVYSPSSGLIDASRDPSNVDWMPSVSPMFAENDPSLFGKTVIVGGKAVFFINREMEVKQIEKDDTGSTNSEPAVTNDQTVTDSDDSQENTDSSDSGSVIYDSGKGGYLPKYTYVGDKIASQAYYASNNQDDFVIPVGTKEIGRFSFARSSIKNVRIPEGVTKIGYGAFYHCDVLSDVSIPSSVTYIDEYAFDNTLYMKKFMSDISGEKFLIVGDGILLAYNGSDETVNIPDSVKSIAAGCFSENESIKQVYVPDSVRLIDSDAFRDCKNLNYINGMNGVEAIGDRAFMGCPLSDVTLPESLKYIGLKAFDFSKTSKADNTKVVAFKGNELPLVTADETSERLSNSDYRKDALYNVLYAVVDKGIDESMLEGSVLDNDTLGFSGIIVSINEDDQTADLIANRIFSGDVLASVSDTFIYNSKEYRINGLDSVSPASEPYKSSQASKDVETLHNGSSESGYSARLSEDENVGRLYVDDSLSAKEALNLAYSKLFGSDVSDLAAYEIKLKDPTDNVDIKRLGQSVLYVTVPLEKEGGMYHVITLDDDGQLEELKASVDASNKSITFETSHLSYFGIYTTGDDNMVLNVKDGKLVKNYRLDESPDTGDHSFSVYYVIAILLLSVGLIMVFSRKKRVG